MNVPLDRNPTSFCDFRLWRLLLAAGLLAATLSLSLPAGAPAAVSAVDCENLQAALDTAATGDVITLTELCIGRSYRLPDVEITLQGDASDSDWEGFDGSGADYRALTGEDVEGTVIKDLLFRDYETSAVPTSLEEVEDCPAPYLPDGGGGCQLDSTAASADGGAVLVYGGSWPTFDGNLCINNEAVNPQSQIGISASGNGGCFAVHSETPFTGGDQVVFSDNTFTWDGEEDTGNRSGNYGGAVYSESCVGVDFLNNTVEHSEAAGYGGGAYVIIHDCEIFLALEASEPDFSGSDLQMHDNVFADNESYASGGGAYVRTDAAAVSGNLFADNVIEAYEVEALIYGPTDMYGGGLFIGAPSEENGLIRLEGFSALSVYGPSSHAEGPLEQSDNLFEGNLIEEASYEVDGRGGGGEWISGFNTTSVDDRFIENVLEGSYASGGGLGVKAGYPDSILQPTVAVEEEEEYNTFRGYNLVAAGNEIGDNSRGGGVYAGFVNTICLDCGVDLYLFNSTVSGNVANSEEGNSFGPGVAGGGDGEVSHDTLSMFNSIVEGNFAPKPGDESGQNDVYYESFDETTAEYSDVCVDAEESGDPDVPHPGPGNICQDPLLVDPEDGDVHQTNSSPTLEKGSDALVPSFLTTDYEGDPRSIDFDGDGHTVDMGADEKVRAQQPPPPPPPPAADLAVLKTASPNPVVVGQNVTYTITVSNAGPQDASNVVLKDPLPAGASLVSVNPPAGVDCGSFATTAQCTIASLPVGSSKQVIIVVKADAVGALTNTATVSGQPQDPNSANNSATAQVNVVSLGTCLVQASKGKLYVGLRQRLVVTVLRDGQPAAGETIVVQGGGVNLRAETSSTGQALFIVKPTKAGKIIVASVADCDQALVVVQVARDCSGVSISRKTLVVGQRLPLTVRVRLLGQALAGRKVVVRGPGVWRVGWTGPKGGVTLRIKPPRAGIARVTAHLPGGVTCVKRIGLVRPPDGDSLTG